MRAILLFRFAKNIYLEISATATGSILDAEAKSAREVMFASSCSHGTSITFLLKQQHQLQNKMFTLHNKEKDS